MNRFLDRGCIAANYSVRWQDKNKRFSTILLLVRERKVVTGLLQRAFIHKVEAL